MVEESDPNRAMHTTQTQSRIAVIADGIPMAVENDCSMRAHPGGEREPDVGTRVGRYIIEQRIGEGGMGVVYRAFDPEVRRSIALKFARAQHGTVEARVWSRLRREAQALARVHHPGVVSLYEMGQDPRGAYLALELIEGVHLRRWLRQRERPLAQVVAVLERAAVALAAVHRANLLHRDVKPTNILVTADDRVVLVDFGLALGMSDLSTAHESSSGASADDHACRTRMTRLNTIVGTTHYMSPEQLMGRDLDARSDVFSLAVTAYEALYGERPYPETTAYDLAVAYEAGTRPSRPAALVPRWLRAALLAALEIDPAARTASAEDFAAALRPRRTSPLGWLAAVAAGALAGAGVTALGAAARAEPAEPGTSTPHEAGMAAGP